MSFTKVEKVLLKVGHAINAIHDIQKLLANDKFNHKLGHEQIDQAKKSGRNLKTAKKELFVVMNNFGIKEKDFKEHQGELF